MRCTATEGKQVHQHIYAVRYMSRLLSKASITFTQHQRQDKKKVSKEFITCQKNLILNTKLALSAVL